MEELVSIVVPVFNVEKFLKRCLDSIINQTYENIEIILVDDGSQDESGKICDQYSLRDSRIKVIHKGNGGLSSARNVGISKALGKYLLLVDSDDYIRNDTVEVLLNNAIIDNADMVIGGYERIDEEDRIIASNIFDSVILTNDQVKEYFWNSNNDYTQKIVAWGKLYKLPVLKSILEYPLNKINEDEFIAHKLWLNSKSVIILNEKLYYYRYRSGSIMNSANLDLNFDALEAMLDRLDYAIKDERFITNAWLMCISVFAEKTKNYYLYKNRVCNSNNEYLNSKNAMKMRWKEIKKNRMDKKLVVLTIVLLFFPQLYMKYSKIKKWVC